LMYLQNMYQMVNGMNEPTMEVTCPACGLTHEATINFMQVG